MEHFGDGFGIEGLDFNELLGDPVQRVPMSLEDLTRLVMGLCDQAAHLVIDGCCHLIGEILSLGVIPAEEDLAFG